MIELKGESAMVEAMVRKALSTEGTFELRQEGRAMQTDSHRRLAQAEKTVCAKAQGQERA